MIGTTVSHYRILEHLGGGGMGVVYRAEDLKLKRTVALKFLPPEWSRDPDARERFMREARSASALDHPNICTVYEVDETKDGQLFIAMAYCEGETLKKRIERGPQPIAEAIGLVIQVAEGLQRAHEAGIVHRDIKPANVIITERGEAKIVDFGLAKLAGEFGLTQTGTTVGTPHYMSPEQARGDEVGPATDIWSLGAVLYETVSGVRPFRGESGDAVVHSILHEEPLRLRDVRPDTPPMLGRILTRLLEKEPGRRYPSADELLIDLRALEAADSEDGLRTTTMGAAHGKRRRIVAAAGLAAAVAFAVVLTWVLREQSRAPAAPDRLPRIVVLPFENLGPPEDEYFADGLTSEIISRLAVVSGLEVISRTTAMNYKGTGKSISQIGDELGVDYALEGEVRWERPAEGGGRVRITPQLIRVAADAHVWSERYERPMEGVFALQSDIAQRIIGELQVTLLEPERVALEARPTDNMEAYQAYLLGLQYYGASSEEVIARLVVEMLERAVQLDPGFAVAHATLSEAHSVLYHYRYDFTSERLEKARASANRAMELQPGLPEGHRALGFYYYWGFRDYDRALEQLAIAAEALPNDAVLLQGIFLVLRRQGRWDQALEAMERWQRVDPRNCWAGIEANLTYRYLREFGKADEEIRRAIAIAPDLPDAFFFGAAHYVLWDGSTERARHLLASAPSVGSLYVEYESLLLDLYDRKPDVAMARLEQLPFDAFALQEWYVPKSLLECVCLFDMGEEQRAEAACESAVELLEREIEARPYDYRLFSALGHAFALIGRREAAVQAAEHSVELMPIAKDALAGADQTIELAKVYTRAGQHDRAVELIEELLSIPCDMSVGLLRLDPLWDPLRDIPRFQEILEKYGAEE